MDEVDPYLLRHVLGYLATAMTVVTADDGDRPVGMAANSVTAVSIIPPLVLFCPSTRSEAWPRIHVSGRFCINVMAEDHGPVVRRFARRGGDRFEGVGRHARAGGPGLDDALAWIDCEIDVVHEAGDHWIVVARVLELVAAQERSPLIAFRGAYGTFLSEPAA